MEFSRSVRDLTKERVSVRTYEEQKIDPDKLEKIENYLQTLNEGSTTKDRYLLFNMEDFKEEDVKNIWKPPVIKGTRYCIIGISDKREMSEITFGYDFEKIILYATDLGLGSCWLGGAFNRDGFRKHLNLNGEEFVNIITPIGYEKDSFRFMPGAMNLAFRAKSRKPWKVLFHHNVPESPLSEEEAGDYREPLEMVRQAPSGFNRQPWRILKENQKFHFLTGIRSSYGFLPHDLGKVEIGIAMCHFELTAKEKGLKGRWEGLGEHEQSFSLPDKWKYHITWIDES